eukprot:SAG31_NODE_4152_length_3527_cov_22.835764_1_plen_119_part_00
MRLRWQRLRNKLWTVKEVGLGLIPALTHVGGRDLGDYVSAPERFDTSAPGTAHALEAQMARIRYDASDWTPKSATVVDSAELTSHSEDSERVLRADSGGKNAWLPPAVDNLWGERPVG